jgi:hypothetical protein
VLTVAMNCLNKNRIELMDILIAAGAKVNPPRRFAEVAVGCGGEGTPSRC